MCITYGMYTIYMESVWEDMGREALRDLCIICGTTTLHVRRRTLLEFQYLFIQRYRYRSLVALFDEWVTHIQELRTEKSFSPLFKDPNS